MSQKYIRLVIYSTLSTKSFDKITGKCKLNASCEKAGNSGAMRGKSEVLKISRLLFGLKRKPPPFPVIRLNGFHLAYQ